MQMVIVKDAQLPTISCPATVTVNADAGSCAATGVALGTPTTSDNCSVASVTNNAPASFPIGTNYVTWTVRDGSGNSATCMQMVIVKDVEPPQIACPAQADRVVEIGTPWAFDEVTVSDTCGIPTLTVDTITNLACGNTFTAVRTWRVTDASGNRAECSQTVSVVDTTPPTVSIASPTNGQVFFAPADFIVLATAQDANGTIARVEFFEGTNNFAQATNGAPYFTTVGDVPPGNYTLTARAIDACGNASTSAPVSVTVLANPPFTAGTPVYNPQKNWFEQQVHVSNPTYSQFDAVRIYISNLTNTPAITVYNASGQTNGVPYVQTSTPVPPGGYADFLILYYSPLRIAPNPVLQVQFLSGGSSASLPDLGTPQHINRGLMLANRTYMLEFMSASNRVYAVQYTSDLKNWKQAQPYVSGTGTWIQWIDTGAPTTESLPDAAGKRFYRVIELP